MVIFKHVGQETAYFQMIGIEDVTTHWIEDVYILCLAAVASILAINKLSMIFEIHSNSLELPH